MSATIVSPANAINMQSAVQKATPLSVGQTAASAGNKWSIFFGQPQGIPVVDPYGRTPVPNYQLPEGYVGRSLFIEEQIKGYLIESIEPYYTIMLPWMETDQHHIQWNELRFNRTVAGRTPHEGVSNYVTTEKTQHRDHIVRRGLAFIMELDRANTAEGRRDYLNNIKGILQSVLETVAHDTMYVLLTSHDADRMDKGNLGKVSLQSMIQEEVDNFAAFNANNQQLTILLEKYKRLLRRKRGVLGQLLLIIPPESRISLHKVNASPKPVPYYIMGPGGQGLPRDGPEALVMADDGTAIIETRDFVVDCTAPEIQLLTRPMLTAEFYRSVFNLVCSMIWDGTGRPDSKYVYQSCHRDIFVYDEGEDRQERLSFVKAFEHSNYAGAVADAILKTMMDSKTLTRGDFYPSGNPGRRNAHPRLYWDHTEDKPRVVGYFGHLDSTVAEDEHHEMVGVTMLAGTNGMSRESSEMISVAHRFLSDVDNVPYNEDFFKEVIRENSDISTNGGGFSGEAVPQDLRDRWGYDAARRDWKGTAECGGMRLPSKTRAMGDIAHPPGYSSYVGMCEYARHADRDGSDWQKGAKMAKFIVTLSDAIYDRIVEAFPGSEATNAGNRPPWFHRQDGRATFFETVFWTSRHPLALAYLPVVQSPVAGSPVEMEVTEGWNVVPLRLGGTRLGNVGAVGDRIKASLRGLPISDSTTTTTVYVHSTVNGYTVASPEAMYGLASSDDFVAMSKMGSASGAALGNLKNMLLSSTSERAGEAWDSLVSYINSEADDVAPFVIGLQARMGDNEDENIALIHDAVRPNTGLRKTGRRVQRALRAKLVGDGRAVDDAPVMSLQTVEGREFRMSSRPVPSHIVGIASSANRISRLVHSIQSVRARDQPDYSTASVAYVYPGLAADENGRRVFVGGLSDFHTIVNDADSDLRNALAAEERTLSELIEGARSEGSQFSDNLTAVRSAAQPVPFSGSGAAAPAIGARANVDFTKRPTYRRSPLVMTPGIFASLQSGRFATPLVRAMDPRATALAGPFTQPIVGTIPADVWRRPEYASIAGSLDGKEIGHTPVPNFHKAHLDFLVSTGTIDAHRDTDDVFASTTTEGGRSQGGDSSAIESILFGGGGRIDQGPSASKRARTIDVSVGRYEDPLDGGWTQRTLADAGTGGDRRRPLQGTLYTGAVGATESAQSVVAAFGQENFIRSFRATSRISKVLVRMMTQAYLMSPATTVEHWVAPMRKNIYMPINMIWGRPELEHDMNTFILMRGGPETGANLFGHSNFALTMDGMRKMYLGHYTFKHKPVVWNRDNITLMENVSLARNSYRGGGGTEYMHNKEDLSITDATQRPDLIAMVVGAAEKKFPKLLSFSGSLRHADPLNQKRHERASSQFSSASFYNTIYEFDKIYEGQRGDAFKFFEATAVIPAVALPGHQQNYDPTTGRWDQIWPSQSHRKANMNYRGAGAVYRGVATFFEADPDYRRDALF